MVGLGNIDDVYKHYLVVIEENQQLKELLKECRTMIGQLGAEIGTFDVVETMLKIDNAIGEKK